VGVATAKRGRSAVGRRRFSPRVLLAAADALLRERLRAIFKGDDRCQVIDATEDAVQQMNQLQPDVLVLAVRAHDARSTESAQQETGSERPGQLALTVTEVKDRLAKGSARMDQAEGASDRQDNLWPVTLLTRREVQIVSAVVAAYSNKDIAAQFAITETTVKHHLSNIFDKVGVSSRLELAMLAQHHGLARPIAPSTSETHPAHAVTTQASPNAST
jgi:DNA-binding NarL/FixJ family response regulator